MTRHRAAAAVFLATLLGTAAAGAGQSDLHGRGTPGSNWRETSQSWQGVDAVVPVQPPADVTYVTIYFGTAGTPVPWSTQFGNSARLQLLYRQSAIGRPGHIEVLAWQDASAFQRTFNNATFRMCHTSVSNLSSNFGANYGGNTPVVVATYPSLSVGSGAPNGWRDIPVSFDYNNVDNLLIEVTWNTASPGSSSITLQYGPAGYTSRAYAWNYLASTATTIDGSGYNLRLGFTDVPLPTVAVTSPNGGEVWDVGSLRQVTWVQTDADRDSILYSTNGGSTWAFIAEKFPAATSHDWTIPNSPTTQALVKVVARNITGRVEDVSNANFTINLPLPTVVVTAPNGGEVWSVGSIQDITWTHGGGVPVRDSIWYTTNNGATWAFVAEKLPAATTHSWSVPNSPSTEARVSVKTTNASGSTVDLSDAVFTIGSVDAAVAAIVSPGGWLDTGAAVRPCARVRNNGNMTAVGVQVTFEIDSTAGNNVYLNVVTTSIDAGAESTIVFSDWAKPHPARGYLTSCRTVVAGDDNPANDSLTGMFVVTSTTSGWLARSPMPTGTKAIKDGGWLAHNSGNSRIYGSRGNKQLDFFAYDPAGDSWSRRANWLLGTEGKPPSKGSAGCADGAGIIYATKGNSRQGFHAYYANGDSWRQKKDVPLGLSNKNVKGGTDIVWAYKGAVGSPYLLKGLKNEFYRYDVAGDSWQTLSPAPVGGNVKWDKGSWLAYDDANKKIYAHKAKYHEFYRYDVESGLWSGALAAMPIPGSAGSKKSKDGGCGTYVNGSVFALKGGGTVEFWKYDLAGDSWGERTSMPLGTAGKRAKSGADVVTDGTVLYATKGNKSNEFWMYTPDALWLMRHAVGDGLTAGRVAMDDCRIVTIAPNPLAAGFATVRLSSRRAPFSLRIYDAAGRCVQSAVCSPGPEMALDVRCLRPGVYLVRLSGQGFAESQKLVVQR